MDIDEKQVVPQALIMDLTADLRRMIGHTSLEDDEEQIFALMEEAILADSRLELYSFKVKARLIHQVYYTIRKDLGILHPYSQDPQVTEIMVNGRDHIFIERQGIIEKLEQRFTTTEELEELIRRIAGRVHREINELNPIVDARLPDGSRVNAVYKNVALGGPSLTIRKFPEKAFSMQDLVSFGTITQEAADFLACMVVAGENIFISGGTGSGKTSLLNVLSTYIPHQERIIVIEDSAELQLHGVENLVRLECRNANVQGKGLVDMQQLIKTSLRMRPNRIIVGEVRGKEVLDMLQAFNTGHDGSLSTGHGNSVSGMLKRLETMVLQAAEFPIDAIRSQIAEGIDIMVHLGRLPDKSRRVLEIAEICGYEGHDYIINSLFQYQVERGLERTGNKLVREEKLKLRGVKA
ncbi:CpaF family protein [Aminipila butyrica]|uniref:CpaF family protein n=1 Tax=Aminipila butyrica TaxID=433296 RepID=A0A858BVR7_9FIRM|nr:CpaF family protein [Aminipila butyrica]QIB69269.1 CpaF family protein [Aminipila butyrica]